MKKHIYTFDIVINGVAYPRTVRAFASLENCIKKAIATCKDENASRFIIYNGLKHTTIELSYVD